ncbi:MAG: hypothetical protein ACSHYF_06935 [Verrucomicrobiaceae bacterium]
MKKTTAQKKAAAVAAANRKKSPTKKRAKGSVSNGFVKLESDTLDGRSSVKIPLGKALQQFAIRWSYILSRRSRWRTRAEVDIKDEAYAELEGAMKKVDLRPLVKGASLLQVKVPYSSEDVGWEGRIIPWEYLLSNAARKLGNDQRLTIVRHLDTGAGQIPWDPGCGVLFVQCAPKPFENFYSYDDEFQILEEKFPGRVERCINPTLEELRKTIVKSKPGIIHLAGIDNNQARHLKPEIADGKKASSRREDGVILRADTAAGFREVSADQLAKALNAGSGQLFLVTANVYYSASRICALTVAGGAEAAVGFQDTIDDIAAEVILRQFYEGLAKDLEVLPAFSRALDEVRATMSLSGAGIVLWSSHSLIKEMQQLHDSRKERQERQERIICSEELTDLRKWFRVNIEVKQELNFSLLHNNSGGLFEKFMLIKDKEGKLQDVGVEVVLHLGSGSHSYRNRRTLEKAETPIQEDIKVPLTSSIIRTVSEPLRTSLFVEVKVGELIVYQDTFQVTWSPADEWIDDEVNHVWLPSFVLPRDPFVEAVIDRAEKHLTTLTDDRDSAFDGYQQVGLSENLEELKPVDLQVRAIWAAIVFDFEVGYINPPPSSAGQRLRTPSQIQRAGRGTCIDLALLFAACLEYIDVYPVIFLTEGHAFVGYWRSRERFNVFYSPENDRFLSSLDEGGSKKKRGTKEVPQGRGWVLADARYAEIGEEVRNGYLVPIETVNLTDLGGFGSAISEGERQLGGDLEYAFQAMIDIKRAREEKISPLPIIEGVGGG